jgi:hypothetical protein
MKIMKERENLVDPFIKFDGIIKMVFKERIRGFVFGLRDSGQDPV